MSPFHAIIALTEAEREARGLVHTPLEIARQPEVWRATAERVCEAAPLLHRFLTALPGRRLILSGAGSSHYVGLALEGLLRRAGIDATAVASTEITAEPEAALPPGPFGMLSFARSGNSPEGNHAFRLVSRLRPGCPQLVITCNPDGELYQLAGQEAGALRFLLPPEANDQGLAMTSSYTGMVLAGQALAQLDNLDGYRRHAALAAGIYRQVLERYAGLLADVSVRPYTRALFLGTGTLLGAAAEAHLKMQELTAGRVLGMWDSYLGLRHGPMAGLDEHTLVVSFLSSTSSRRRYEVDLLRELAAKGLGGTVVVVGAQVPEGLADIVIDLGPEAMELPDDLRPPVDVAVAQVLALFLSLAYGLTPDKPAGSIINRVVQGVRIY